MLLVQSAAGGVASVQMLSRNLFILMCTGTGPGQKPQLAYALFPDGFQLAQAQAHSTQILGSLNGLNFAVATFSRQSAKPRVALCVSLAAEAAGGIKQEFYTPAGAEITFKFVSPTLMR